MFVVSGMISQKASIQTMLTHHGAWENLQHYTVCILKSLVVSELLFRKWQKSKVETIEALTVAFGTEEFSCDVKTTVISQFGKTVKNRRDPSSSQLFG